MPYRVEYKPRKDGKNWAIINKDIKKVVGRSSSKEKAKASTRARMMAHYS